MSVQDALLQRDAAITDQQLTRSDAIAAGVRILADAAQQGPFSINDVRAQLRLAGVEAKLTGAVVSAALAARVIRPIGSEPSTDDRTHGKPIAIYVAFDAPTPDARDLVARPAVPAPRLSYAQFLAAKQARIPRAGFDCTPDELPAALFPFQREAVARLVRIGRGALWADTGLGKTRMQLVWLDRMLHDGQRGLILAPLAVAQQTIREAAQLGITVSYVRDADESAAAGDRIVISNYDRLHLLRASDYTAVVLDESSVLKDVTTKTRDALIDAFAQTPYRLACSATPAPNDVAELANHAEFLGAATRRDMLAKFFVSDLQGNKRVKGHAEAALWDWIAQWAVAFRKPSDLGFSDAGFDLPPLEVIPVTLPVDVTPEGQLFATDLGGVSGRAKVRRATLDARVARTLELVNDCGSHAGSAQLARTQPRQGAVLSGADQGTAQHTAAGAVCGGSGATPQGDRWSATSAEPLTNEAQGEDVRPHAGGSRDPHRSGLCDLRGESAGGSDGADAHRSRPQDRHGPRCSLSVVQSGDWPLAGRPDPRHEGDGVSPACTDQWLIWCGLNAEQDALAEALGDQAVSISGRVPPEKRLAMEDAWRVGDVRILITKPDVYAYGMNWQHCARMAFVGLGDSYETYYQCIRRCWRYGQHRPVRAYVVLSELEAAIAENVAKKERAVQGQQDALIARMHREDRTND